MDDAKPDDTPRSRQGHAESESPAPIGRPNPGWWPPGTSGNPAGNPHASGPMRHGGRSARVAALALPEQAEARAALGERTSAIVGDLGGPGALSAVALGLIERHARLELVSDFLFENIQRLGPLTGKGRTRAALSAWLAVVDRLRKSAITLGLERRSKPVNPLDAVRQAVIEVNKT